MAKKKKRKTNIDKIFIITGSIAVIFAMIVMIVKKEETKVTFDKKAVWVSYLNMETLKDKNEEQFEANFTTICEQAKANQLNTIIVHVRPFMDAMYPSDKFMSSFYLTSDKAYDYDPLAIMIKKAHQYDLQFEAWVNPYRIANEAKQLERFRRHSPIASWLGSNHILQNGSTAILNPASKEARAYIVEGVNEIIANYDVDSIHFDDYFYLEPFFTNTSSEQRKEHVNTLIKEVYTTIKEKDASINFGISPQGNLDNARNAGADIDTWLQEEGYVDYVMPQIYWTNKWGMDGSISMFSNRLEAYDQIHTNENVKLYAGLAMYLTHQEVADDAGWKQDTNNLAQQAKLLKEKGWKGYSLFDYDSMIHDFSKEEREHLINIIK